MDNNTLKLICSGCGSSLEYSAGNRALKCMYCDAITAIEQAPNDDGRPSNAELVVPLGVTRAALEDVVYAHLAQGNLTPDNLLEHAVFSKVEQFYVPAFIYRGTYEADWTASFGFDRQEQYTVYEKDSQGRSRPVTKTKTVTDWRPVNGADRGDFTAIAYAGERLSAAGLDLPRIFIERPAVDELKPFDTSYVTGFEAEPFTVNAQEAYTVRGSDLVDAQIDAGVKQHAQGDRQRDWRWKATTSKTDTSVFLPICHVVYDYEGRTYNVWTDGTTGEKLVADPAPVDHERKKAIRWGYAPLVVSLLAAGGGYAYADAHRIAFSPGLAAGAVVAALVFAAWRKHSILSYSKGIRQALLSQRQLKSVDSLQLGSAERQALLERGTRPSRPFLSMTSKDAMLIPAVSLIAAAVFLVPLIPASFKDSPTPSYASASKPSRPQAPAAPSPVQAPPQQRAQSVETSVSAAAVAPVAAAAVAAAPVVAQVPAVQVAATPKIQFDPQLKQMLIAASKHQWDVVDSATAAPLALRNVNRDRAAGRAANTEGKSALQRGENQAAIEAFTRGVEADAVDPEIVNNLAFAYQESGAHAEAIGALNETLRLAPRRVAAWANLSASLAETGDAAASAAALSLALHYSGSRQKTLTFLGEQAQNGRSDAARAVASAVLSAADEIPTLGDNVTTARADVPARATSPRPARADAPTSQIKAEEAYAKQMNRQLEQQLRELSQK
ncbi:tetratricopeptide repeat protein [Variovorax sp. H27-G14]|uniref:tetratricopeptide repeat protein n=1 Tax=Variovorax sp. H27-G14 TaxID=3111914 RepID=UPI0038FCAC3B